MSRFTSGVTGRALSSVWALGLLAWGAHLWTGNRLDGARISDVHVTFDDDSATGVFGIAGGPREAPSWPRGTVGSTIDEEWGELWTVRAEGSTPGGILFGSGMGLLPFTSLLPTELSLAADTAASLVLRAPEGRAILALLPDRVVVAPRGSRLDDTVTARDLLDGVVLAADHEPLRADLRWVPRGEDPMTARTDLENLLDAFDRVWGPLDGTGTTVVIEDLPTESPLPTIEVGEQLLLGWSPGSPLSAQRFVRTRIERTLPPALDPAEDWIRHAVAARVAVRIVAEAGIAESEEALWRSLFGDYTFLYPSRERPLTSWPEATGKTRDYLAYLKGPLTLRTLELVEPDVGNGSPTELWRRIADGVSRTRLSVVSSGHFGPEATSVLADAVGELGFLDAGLGGGLLLTPEPRREETAAPEGVVHLALTSSTENFLESCGCRSAQGGGLARRITRIRRERERAPLSFALDLGNFAPRMDPGALDDLTRAEIRLHLEAMIGVGYEGFAMGVNELYYGEELMQSMEECAEGRLGACNIGEPGDALRALRRLEVGELPVTLIAVGQVAPRWIRPEEYERRTLGVRIATPAQGLARLAPEAPELARSDEGLVIVYGRIHPWHVADLVERFPGVDVVLSSDANVLPRGGWVATGERAKMHSGVSGFVGDTFVAFHGLAEFSLGLLELTHQGGRVVAADREHVNLDSEIPKDPETLAALDALYESAFAGSPTDPIFADSELERALLEHGVGGYVGDMACRTCHVEQHSAWLATPHAGAYPTLVRAHRERSPHCVKCHVTGMGLPTGFTPSAEQPIDLRNVQCEVCHGPGRQHAFDHPGDTSLIRRTISIDACERCHDSEHSDPLRERMEESWAIGAHRTTSSPSQSSSH